MGIFILVLGVVLVLLVIGIIIFMVVRNSKNKYQVVSQENEETIEKIEASNKKISKKKAAKLKEMEIDKIRKSTGLPYYNYYDFSIKEKILWSAVGMVVIFGVGMIFYNHIICSLILSLIGLYYPKMKKKEIIRKRKARLLLQFKEALYSLSGSLSAGRAVPSAFADACEEMKIIFDEGPDNLILVELEIILKRIDRNETIEDALKDFAERSDIEEIITFADVFAACIRTGGNLKKVIMDSSKMIGDKISIKQEIQTLLSGKEFEAKVLTLIPFGLVLLMKITAPDLLENLYSFFGRIMATIAIFIILLSSIWARKIVRIEV